MSTRLAPRVFAVFAATQDAAAANQDHRWCGIDAPGKNVLTYAEA
jgi:hypothetical protein